MVTTLSQAIDNAVRPLLLQAWIGCVDELLAREAAARCDWRSALVGTLVALDDPTERLRLVQHGAPPLSDRVIDTLLARKSIINSAIEAAGHNAQSVKRLTQRLTTLVPPLLTGSSYDAAVVASPFPKIWKRVADLLAVDIAAHQPSTPEWATVNGLLLVAQIHACVAPLASFLDQSIRRSSRLGIRGAHVRIPAVIDSNAVRDPVPAILATAITLRARPWSELYGGLVHELQLVNRNAGAVHQILDAARPAPTGFVGTPAQFTAIRSAGYSLYEWTAIGYMALAAMEQLLRAWAQSLGVSHFKNGRPSSWNDWSALVPLSGTTRSLVDEMYEPTSTNIRNRVMHGGLLEVEANAMEVTMRAAGNVGAAWATTFPAQSPFLPGNIAQHCLRALAAVEAEAPNTLSTSDRGWESAIALTRSEIKWGYRDVYCDFLSADGDAYRWRLFRYLDAVIPAAATFAKVGFHGWISDGLRLSSRHFVQHIYLALTFETLYRATAQLLNQPVLQVSRKAGVLRVQYRMLDERPGSLYEEPFVLRLLGHLADCDRPLARRVLDLAIKARNALAHGACVDFDDERWKGEGHIFVKAIQLLMEAGLEHMTREAAYYRWEQHRAIGPDDRGPLSDWIDGEDEIERLMFGDSGQSVLGRRER